MMRLGNHRSSIYWFMFFVCFASDKYLFSSNLKAQTDQIFLIIATDSLIFDNSHKRYGFFVIFNLKVLLLVLRKVLYIAYFDIFFLWGDNSYQLYWLQSVNLESSNVLIVWKSILKRFYICVLGRNIEGFYYFWCSFCLFAYLSI